jgi:hypothetical protein
MGAGVEICNLQNFGSANAAKECVQERLLSSVATERGSQISDLMTKAYL